MNEYEHIFENSPISIWEEDWSKVKTMLDKLRPNVKSTEMQYYLEEHPDFVLDLLKAIKVLRVNKKTIEMYEASSEKELTSSINDTFCAESFDTFKHELIALYKGDKDFEMEALTKTLKGNDLYTIVNVKFPSEQDYSKVILTMVNITPSKITHHKYLASKAKFHQSFYQGVVGMCITDAEGAIIEVNDSFCKLIGYKKEELICMNSLQLEYGMNLQIPKDMSALIRRDVDCVKEIRQLEKKDKTPIWVLVGLNLVRDEDNHPLYFVEQIVDIDKEKKYSFQLKKNVEKYQQLLESTNALYVILDSEGEITDCSETFLKSLKADKECITGKSLRQLVSAESMECFDSAMKRVWKGETVNCVEISITKDDAFQWVSLNCSMLQNGGIKVFVLMSDITERKRREFQKLINKEKHRDKLRNEIRNLRNMISEKDK